MQAHPRFTGRVTFPSGPDSMVMWGVETALAYDDLRDWIKALDKAGELKHIQEPVDPILEIAEITDRVSKWGKRAETKSAPGGPALLFENVKGLPGQPGADEPVRQRTAHEAGARGR